MMLLNVRKGFGRLLASSALVIGLIGSASAAPKPEKGDRVPGELIVKFKAHATDGEIERGLKRGRLKVRRHKQTEPMKQRGHNGVTVVESDLGTDEALAQLQNDPAIEYVEPNYIYKHHLASNDPYVTGNYTWGLYSGASSPANTFGSGASEAWTAGYTGANTVYVAVIDEGVDVSHPELSANMWKNPFDPADGVDNDGNGYVDDLNGWNFYGDNNQVFDSSGDTHGTHVAGTIGARGGNGFGLAGVNWNVTMISGKFLGADGGDTLSAVEAIDYFIDLKTRHSINLVAINASWGGSGYSRTLHDAIIRAAKAGIVFVAAAGNSALNNDVSASYPANIDTTKGTITETAASYNGVISVAAIDSTGALASFSNYGSKTVHIGAPGVQILSCTPNLKLGYMSGTSMAAPHVTGAVALYASTHPGATAQSIRSAIVGAVTSTPSLAGKTTTGGRLNVANVVKPVVVAPAVPAAPTGVSVSAAQTFVSGAATATVRWNASDGAINYRVKRATSSAGPWSYVAYGVTGTSYSHAVTANNNNVYYYRVVAMGSGGESAESATATVSTIPASPINLVPTALSSSTVQLKWTDRSSDEQGFKIEWWTSAGWVQIGTVGPGVTTVNISGTSSRVTYAFRVRAYNGALNTPYSNYASLTMP